MSHSIPPTITTLTIPTSHATLSALSAGPQDSNTLPLLLIHGNSFCNKIFRPLLLSRLSQTRRLIAMDLPGHGSSSNSPTPEKSYTQPGYAGAAVELLRHLHIDRVVVMGWSLGGHVAIEMLPLAPGLVRGLVLVGSPPVGPGQIARAFRLGDEPRASAPAKEVLSAEELEGFSRGCADAPYEQWMGECVARTDGRARSVMFEGFLAGECCDQAAVVEDTDVLTAVVNGAMEPWIDLEYVRSVPYGNLWRGQCFELEGLKHAPFWGDPEKFVGILEEFLADVEEKERENVV